MISRIQLVVIGTLSSVALGVSLTIVLSSAADGDDNNVNWPTYGWGFFLLVASMAGFLTSLFFIVRVDERRTLNATIALAGPPGAGKTAFASVLYSQLMEGRLDGLSFVAEARTAQYVFRAVRGIREQSWPPSTDSENIRRYRGTVSLKGRSSLVNVLRRPVRFSLELGDSAGENWEQLAKEQRDEDTLGLVESTFFEYVSSSGALFYFIPADLLVRFPEAVARLVDDLASTIVLLRSIQAGDPERRLRMPVCVVISKSDLLDFEQALAINKLLLSGSRAFSISDAGDPSLDPQLLRSIDQLERLVAILANRVESYAGFLVSSICAIGEEMSISVRREYFRRARETAELAQLADDDLASYSTQLGDFRSPITWALRNLV